ncbi:deoxyguanosinetriphosphate triphosphohydrolase [Branchiibius sp. NY16-3462-2]|uniref:deoxyguanosinetriphosphate triphosphohydrolase n=1 Tax=Branchiibius sp. NY16-3462-2 TaxID=1807500 RepID=UPI00079976C1|nr:deoxyguanosinetriphosphate triphosphohydrolase [Branchiibius sp. NY16-3462-2]KYH43720.1 deoxyguanosinetriphosphate triphosphohydrolase [Branchiibius sp. NY16-3462-2]
MSGYLPADRERFLGEDPAQKSGDRDDFARDRARVLHSAALRRLAAKTQVLQPGSDDFIRNRLTHSLEVAQIGREFGAALGCNGDVVDTACLAHDLGHPPFGHNGEDALARLAADIGGFEGNAQTLRILTRLEPKRSLPDGRSVGLNLTRASLDAATKYPWGIGENPSGAAKFGVYEDDRDVFDWVRSLAPIGRASLEAQVMDWSDDVAYSVHDVEDGVAAEHIDLVALRDPGLVDQLVPMAQQHYAPDLPGEVLREGWSQLLASGVIPASYDGTRSSQARLKDMTSRLIGHFVGSAVAATRETYGQGQLTRYDANVVVPDLVRAECAMLKTTALLFVMLSDVRAALLSKQQEIVAGLVEAYEKDPARLDPMQAEAFSSANSDGEALRVIVDQVASLTDVRAHLLAGEWL